MHQQRELLSVFLRRCAELRKKNAFRFCVYPIHETPNARSGAPGSNAVSFDPNLRQMRTAHTACSLRHLDTRDDPAGAPGSSGVLPQPAAQPVPPLGPATSPHRAKTNGTPARGTGKSICTTSRSTGFGSVPRRAGAAAPRAGIRTSFSAHP